MAITESLPSKPIPIKEAERIAKKYGYDQVIIYGRNCLTAGNQHMTTYGRNRALCDAAGKIGKWFQIKMGWYDNEERKRV